ncbi:unnamed protein product [Vicia faba]|uniref:Uncharacterized protein n=1 Tax=Vicia faba TaxID=3906 RepID=A0AAV0YK09_VICFA|nr:unnamed protein product [Vicia faba]
MAMKLDMEEGCRTPRHSGSRILSAVACPGAPKKKAAISSTKMKVPPKNVKEYRRLSLHYLHKVEADEDGINNFTTRRRTSSQSKFRETFKKENPNNKYVDVVMLLDETIVPGKESLWIL